MTNEHAHGAGGATPTGTSMEPAAASIDAHGMTRRRQGDEDPIAAAIGRALLAGIEVQRLEADAWLPRCAHGATIGTVHGTDALHAAVAGFEAAQRDVRALLNQKRGQQ